MYLDKYLSISLCDDFHIHKENDSYNGLEIVYENVFNGTWKKHMCCEYIPDGEGRITAGKPEYFYEDTISSAEMIHIIADWPEDESHYVSFEEGGDIMLKLADCNVVAIDSDLFEKIGDMWHNITNGKVYTSKTLARYIGIVNTDTDWNIIYG